MSDLWWITHQSCTIPNQFIRLVVFNNPTYSLSGCNFFIDLQIYTLNVHVQKQNVMQSNPTVLPIRL